MCVLLLCIMGSFLLPFDWLMCFMSVHLWSALIYTLPFSSATASKLGPGNCATEKGEADKGVEGSQWGASFRQSGGGSSRPKDSKGEGWSHLGLEGGRTEGRGQECTVTQGLRGGGAVA